MYYDTLSQMHDLALECRERAKELKPKRDAVKAIPELTPAEKRAKIDQISQEYNEFVISNIQEMKKLKNAIKSRMGHYISILNAEDGQSGTREKLYYGAINRWLDICIDHATHKATQGVFFCKRKWIELLDPCLRIAAKEEKIR